MGDGSDSIKRPSRKDEPSTVTTTPAPAFMPGFDSMIAQQLGMGGYGDPSTLLAAMQAIQTPMNIPAFKPGATPKSTGGDRTTSGGGGRSGLGGGEKVYEYRNGRFGWF